MSQLEENVNNSYETRWDLCLYIFILCVLSQLSRYILLPIFKFIQKPSPDELELRNRMSILRKEQNELSIKDFFSTHAKLQRQLNKLEDELKEIVRIRLEKNVKRKLIIEYGFTFLIHIIIISFVMTSRSEPIIVLKQNLYPFEGLFSYPSRIPHAITPYAWVIISKVSCSTMMKTANKISDFLKIVPQSSQ